MSSPACGPTIVAATMCPFPRDDLDEAVRAVGGGAVEIAKIGAQRFPCAVVAPRPSNVAEFRFRECAARDEVFGVHGPGRAREERVPHRDASHCVGGVGELEVECRYITRRENAWVGCAQVSVHGNSGLRIECHASGVESEFLDIRQPPGGDEDRVEAARVGRVGHDFDPVAAQSGFDDAGGIAILRPQDSSCALRGSSWDPSRANACASSHPVSAAADDQETLRQTRSG